MNITMMMMIGWWVWQKLPFRHPRRGYRDSIKWSILYDRMLFKELSTLVGFSNTSDYIFVLGIFVIVILTDTSQAKPGQVITNIMIISSSSSSSSVLSESFSYYLVTAQHVVPVINIKIFKKRGWKWDVELFLMEDQETCYYNNGGDGTLSTTNPHLAKAMLHHFIINRKCNQRSDFNCYG